MKIIKFKKCDSLFACLTTCVFILLIANFSEASEYCVDTAADLRSALEGAQSNGEDDIIRIMQGTYIGNFIYDADEFETYNLIIKGGYKPKPPGCKKRVVDPANTVLDADGSGRVLTLDCSGVAADLVVDGVTLQNGSLISGNGGGIFVATNQGNALIKNSAIKNNTGAGSGGGAYLTGNETVNLISNLFEGNSGGTGGGVLICEASSVNMTENTITDNHVSGQAGAGGVSIGSDGCGKPAPELVTFSNNVVSNNSSDWDWGGILIKGNGATITADNNTLANNIARDGGGGKIAGGGGLTPPGVVVFTNNIVSENLGIEGSGGIRISGDNEVSVKDNFIIGNSAGPLWGFGGITISGTITINLTNNIICNNSGQNAPGGTHISFPSFSPESVLAVTNNTICQNTSADYGGGIKIDLENEAQSANIYNNIIWANSAILGSDIYLKNDGNNNGTPSPVNLYNNDFNHTQTSGIYIQIPFTIDTSNLNNQNPQFDTDGYHLTASSPCIDAGATVSEPTDDIDGDSRPQGSGYDIGADEFVPAMLDLDITRFTATKRVNLGSNKNIVEISLAVKNMGTHDDSCPATVVGSQGGFEVHSEEIDVYDAIGKGPTTFEFQPYAPDPDGDIVWTVIVEDDDPDVDEAITSTTVSQ